jgi:hypothetical protein
LPSLCHAIPAFEVFMERWRELSMEIPAASPMIMAGLAKLEKYQDRMEEVPAYVVAMGKSASFSLIM